MSTPGRPHSRFWRSVLKAVDGLLVNIADFYSLYFCAGAAEVLLGGSQGLRAGCRGLDGSVIDAMG